MNPYSPSPALAVAIITAQLFGPAVLWAAEQRGIRVEANRQIVVSALNGDRLTLQGAPGTKALQFREVVPEGATLTTDAGTTAEILIGNRAVVTLANGTTAKVHTVSADQTTIRVTKGTVRVASAASAIGSQGLVTVQTPSSHVQTRGGIVHVLVDAPVSKAEHSPTGAQVYRTSYTPETMVASATAPSEIIHVEEGTAEIPGIGPTGGPLTLKAGQRVTVEAGRARSLAEAVNPGGITTSILAATGHTQTPKEGRDHLVALQIDQASQLGKAITGAAETGDKESDKKSDSKNTINGATGGVTLVNALFGTGSTASSASSIPGDRPGAGYGGFNSHGFAVAAASNVKVNVNDHNALLVFTTRDPVGPYVMKDVTLQEAFQDLGPNFQTFETNKTFQSFTAGQYCDAECLAAFYFDAQSQNARLDGELKSLRFAQSGPYPKNLVYKPVEATPIQSSITVNKELVLIGGTGNVGHGGAAPMETLIARGITGSTQKLPFTDRSPLDSFKPSEDTSIFGVFTPMPPEIVGANSTLVVESPKDGLGGRDPGGSTSGGTLGQYSDDPSGLAIEGTQGLSHVDGSITATGTNVNLTGGVSLDQGTTATIGQTDATKNYFASLEATFTGSLLSVINGPNGPTKLTMQDRILGVYDGSIVQPDQSKGGKALLSLLNAKLVGPSKNIPLIDIASGTHFDRDGKATPGSPPNVTVTSALVTRSTLTLDGALLEASAPLVALTKANMTTTSHFADLAGSPTQSLNLNGALVSLSASNLLVKGNLLNLNNATAAISGYLFSLTNGSTLQINNGALFSLNGNSSLTLNGNAFGVFGGGTNTVTIDNNLCGTGAACGALVNSAGQAITLQDGTALQVSGVTQNIVLPNNFNAFALAPGATASNAKIDIDANDALFHIDPTSTLTINGTKVK